MIRHISYSIQSSPIFEIKMVIHKLYFLLGAPSIANGTHCTEKLLLTCEIK